MNLPHSITLPAPPSVNKAWRYTQGRAIKSREARQWARSAEQQILGDRLHWPNGRANALPGQAGRKHQTQQRRRQYSEVDSRRARALQINGTGPVVRAPRGHPQPRSRQWGSIRGLGARQLGPMARRPSAEDCSMSDDLLPCPFCGGEASSMDVSAKSEGSLHVLRFE